MQDRSSPSGRSRAIDGSGATDSSQLHRSLRRNRRRLVGCLLGTAAAFALGVWLNGLWPSLLGVPLAVAPGLAATVALLAYATWPVSDPASRGPATASLSRREPWSFGRRQTLLVPAITAATYLVLLAAAGAVAQPDDAGRMRAFGLTQGDMSALASPFPGSSYGLLLAAVTVLLAAATYAALWRMATSPAIVTGSASPEALAIDRRWREISTRVIIRTATAALLGYAGGTLAIAGSAILPVSDFGDNGGTATPWVGVGWTAAVFGGLALLTAAVVAGSVIAALLSLRAGVVLGSRTTASARIR